MQNFTTLGQLLLGESKDLRRGEKTVPLIVGSTFATQPFWGGVPSVHIKHMCTQLMQQPRILYPVTIHHGFILSIKLG